MKRIVFVLFCFMILFSGCKSNHGVTSSNMVEISNAESNGGYIIAFSDKNTNTLIPVAINKAEVGTVWNSKYASKLLSLYLVSDEFQKWVNNDWLINYGVECKIRDSRNAFDSWLESSNIFELVTDDMSTNISIDDNSVKIVNSNKVQNYKINEVEKEKQNIIFDEFIELTNDGDIKDIIQKAIVDSINK